MSPVSSINLPMAKTLFKHINRQAHPNLEMVGGPFLLPLRRERFSPIILDDVPIYDVKGLMDVPPLMMI